MKVKICGIRDVTTAKMAVACGAAFIGFIFYPPSRRYIEPEKVAAIAAQIKDCWKVGVFVDEDAAVVNRIAALCGLDFVQLHGHEDAVYARRIHCAIIKAYRWGDGFSAREANDYPAEYILLDSFTKGMAGGTGCTFAWQEAAKETKLLQKPLLIAGGIAKENVLQAQEIFQPFGVDVSGSLEVEGKKSFKKIQAFMDTVRRE